MPSAGLAETPENASDPPHSSATFRRLTGTVSRWQVLASQQFLHQVHALFHGFARAAILLNDQAAEHGAGCGLHT